MHRCGCHGCQGTLAQAVCAALAYDFLKLSECCWLLGHLSSPRFWVHLPPASDRVASRTLGLFIVCFFLKMIPVYGVLLFLLDMRILLTMTALKNNNELFILQVKRQLKSQNIFVTKFSSLAVSHIYPVFSGSSPSHLLVLPMPAAFPSPLQISLLYSWLLLCVPQSSNKGCLYKHGFWIIL